jgi:hypothetical protein
LKTLLNTCGVENEGMLLLVCVWGVGGEMRRKERREINRSKKKKEKKAAEMTPQFYAPAP